MHAIRYDVRRTASILTTMEELRPPIANSSLLRRSTTPLESNSALYRRSLVGVHACARASESDSVLSMLRSPLRPAEPPLQDKPLKRRVAVVGAGAAGLAAAKALRDASLDVVVLESGSGMGGTWRYDPAPGSHSAVYASLRTNLPRELMGFTSFSFTRDRSYGDDRRFCGHAEVQAYLCAYAAAFSLESCVRFRTRVLSAEPQPEGRWLLSLENCDTAQRETLLVDALVVANGHYSHPRRLAVPGLESAPCVLHSHEYRTPQAYEQKTVLVVGNAASGEDLSREIATVAHRVLLSARELTTSSTGVLQTRPLLVNIAPGGVATFTDGSSDLVDAVLLATGYQMSFPFLAPSVLDPHDNALPLYEHMWLAAHPTLVFLGIPWRVCPFPLFELQAAWAARVFTAQLRCNGVLDR